jgi:hypothetical protein
MSQDNMVRVGRVLVDYGPQDPPMFDWSDFLVKADQIIERVGKPKHRPRADRNPGKGLPLSHLRDEIAKLLADVCEFHAIENDAFNQRNDPVKQSMSWAHQNSEAGEYTLPDDKELLESLISGPIQEFAPDDLWEYHYKAERKNPGKSHTNGLPVAPLHVVYESIRAWWRKNGFGGFSPTFADGDDEKLHNADSRFLLAVIQTIDERYTVSNARGLYETARKRERRKRGAGHRSSSM